VPARHVKLTFAGPVGKEPIIYQLGKNFDLITNIRRADVVGDAGWVVLYLEGEDSEIERGLQFCRQRGVVVEKVEDLS
jgi:hypothetical protein